MSDAERVADLIKRVGIAELGYLDGCICCDFSVRGVNVSIACGKGGEREIVVGSRSLDYQREAELLPVLQEVERQALALNDGRGAFKLIITPIT